MIVWEQLTEPEKKVIRRIREVKYGQVTIFRKNEQIVRVEKIESDLLIPE